MKVVISIKHGGFGLSRAAADRLRAEGHPVAVAEFERHENPESLPAGLRQAMNTLTENHWLQNIPRDDPSLVRLVEEMGQAANGRYAKLKVVEIPDDVEWEIEAYDGWEQVAEKHRVWS